MTNKEFKKKGLKIPALHADVHKVFKKSFVEPQSALSDFAEEQLDLLKKSEENFNQNVKNGFAQINLMETSRLVAKNLE